MTALAVALIATALIALALAIALRALLRFTRDITTGASTEILHANNRFLRQLENEARTHANTTGDHFASIVLDKISEHMEELNTLKNTNAEKARSRFTSK